MAIVENDSSVNGKAITGKATGDKGIGIYGEGKALGVRGDGETWHGVAGLSKSTTGGFGVYGKNTAGGTGVAGESDKWVGVYGQSKSTTGGAGVMGEGDPGPGVIGKSTKWVGVYGETAGIENGPAGVWGEHKGAGIGVKAVSKDGAGLVAHSASNEAIRAETKSPGTAAIAAYNTNPSGTGAAIFAKKEGTQGHAGFFDGNVWVGGELAVGKDVILANADCAEDFDVLEAELMEPGTVMVLGEGGKLECSRKPYDKRVAGVISGAGEYKPGIILDKQSDLPNRKPIALLGKVYCKVDASDAPIEIGDLLTTSPTTGHAMKAVDPLRSFGAVIGKALAPLAEGRRLLPILIALQ